MAQPIPANNFDPATEPIDERTQVLVGLATEGQVAVWLLLTYRYTACTVQALWPRHQTAALPVPRHAVDDQWWNALDEVIVTRIVPAQQLPESATDSDHWTTFASVAHDRQFRRLRGQRLVSSTWHGHPSVYVLGAEQKTVLLASTGSELMDLWEGGYEEIADLLSHVNDDVVPHSSQFSFVRSDGAI